MIGRPTNKCVSLTNLIQDHIEKGNLTVGEIPSAANVVTVRGEPDTLPSSSRLSSIPQGEDSLELGDPRRPFELPSVNQCNQRRNSSVGGRSAETKQIVSCK